MALTDEQVAELKKKVDFLLENAPFQTAKSMPNIPHAYTLKKNWGANQKFFLNVAQFVKKFGVKEKFYNRWYTYYHIGDYKYWVMDANPEDAVLINRAKK